MRGVGRKKLDQKTKVAFVVSFELPGGRINTSEVAELIRRAIREHVVPEDWHPLVRVRLASKIVTSNYTP